MRVRMDGEGGCCCFVVVGEGLLGLLCWSGRAKGCNFNNGRAEQQAGVKTRVFPSVGFGFSWKVKVTFRQPFASVGTTRTGG